MPLSSSPGGPPNRVSASSFMAGGGDMGRLMRDKDWSQTALGPAENWPQSLKTAVRIMLTSRQPIWIGWGRDLIYLYNDPYRAIIGGKHPWALGEPARVVWREIWPVIDPMLAQAMAGDEGTYVESQFLVMERHGYREETYYTFSYSPIPNDDGSAGGIICANTDDTRRVIGERQLALLRQLAIETANVRTVPAACAGAAEALGSNPRDIPFALIYVSGPGGSGFELAGRVAGTDGLVQHHWPLDTVLAEGKTVLIEPLPPMPGTDAPVAAALVPLSVSGQGGRGGVLVVGLNPLRLFDESYRNFLSLVGGQIAASLASAQAYEEEKRRAEALAQLDRAKTEFFSNVSHEFRTPLTLMLGPIEDMLDKSYTDLTPATKNQLEIVHRNSLRLLKLVNTMLDFSRIEAGRVEVNYAAVDLAAFTAELASVFRAAVERAGLRLIVHCPPLPAPVFVDRDMWEKIVLNLLSNAFKFTLVGEIEIALEAADDKARLTVRDTGVGIPPDEVDRVFDRFHRVKESRGRTHEGTGIGLALVQELVRLHGGDIRVTSRLDEGSRFVVTVPLGRAHLDERRIRALPERASGNLGAQVFAQEALRWTPGGEPELDQLWARSMQTEQSTATVSPEAKLAGAPRPRVLWADDNADMRDYVRRLLGERFEVTAVGDGQAALEAARAHPPELVLSDVMMPRLDGFGLLQALRAEPALATIPVILLSARAGEEARVEGAEAGADDYLIKPFSARELLARVEAHAKMARFRREAAAALREANNELGRRLHQLEIASTELKASRQAALTLMQDAVESRNQIERLNSDLRREAAERETAGRRLAQRTAQFETLLQQAPIGVYVVDADFKVSHVNPLALPVFGAIPDVIGRGFDEVIRIIWPEEVAAEVLRVFRHTLATGEPYSNPELIEQHAERNVTEYYQWRIDRIVQPDGRFGVVCYFQDISVQVRTRLSLKDARDEALAANRAKDEFLAALSHELRTPLNPVLLIASEACRDKTLPEQARADFKMIVDNVSLQARLIDDLLDLSRITRGKINLDRQILDLHDAIRDAVRTIEDEITAKQQALTFELRASAVTVNGDPVRLRQVIWNLLRNAVKFTPPYGRVLISSTNLPDSGDIEVRVTDSGIGMRPEELGRIFDPFVQGQHAEGGHTPYGGLGLGLAICRMLVEALGGSVTAESPGVNLGATLIVRLPVATALPGPESPRTPALDRAAPSVSNARIHKLLFVEDHAPTRATIVRLLERRGYEVVPAESVKDALRQAEKGSFDLLVSDLGLPDGDGCGLMTELRKTRRDLRGIAISGYGMEADVARSQSAGFTEHLTKPVAFAALEKAISRVLTPPPSD